MWRLAVALLVGEALVFLGAWMIYPPGALIELGLQVIPAALLTDKRA